MKWAALILALLFTLDASAQISRRRAFFATAPSAGGGGGGALSNTPVVVASNVWATATGAPTGTNFTITVSGFHPKVYITANSFQSSDGLRATNTTTGLQLTQRFTTNSYNAADCFKGWWDSAPNAGANVYIVTNRIGASMQEFAGEWILITNANSIGTVNVSYVSGNRTGVTNTLTTTSNDLVLHIIGHNKSGGGSGSFDGTQTLIANANDGANDASVKVSKTNATVSSTTLKLTGATSGQLTGVAETISP